MIKECYSKSDCRFVLKCHDSSNIILKKSHTDNTLLGSSLPEGRKTKTVSFTRHDTARGGAGVGPVGGV